MPPESLPRDRKDLLREKKNERSLSENIGGGGRGENRWRDIRRPAGCGKQGGFPMLSEEPFHGSGPSRSNDKILDDETGRPFGKYGRSDRDNRDGPLSQRGWKVHSWDAAVASSQNGTARMQADVNDKRSVDGLLARKSHSRADVGNNCNQFHFKDQNDMNLGVRDSCTGQRFDGENPLGSIDWKTLNWTRSGSLSSRGSGLSHSSSSRSMGVDSSETKVDLHPQNVSPLQSPSGDAAAASPAATEETSSRKKPRLGWGEGLAKFEKKKVDSTSDTVSKNGMIVSESNGEHVRSHVLNVPDRRPSIAGCMDGTSPATPSSVACNSSPGVEDKSQVKAANVDASNICISTFPESQNQYEDLSSTPVTLEETPIANLRSSLTELLQCNDPSSLDDSARSTTFMNKLLLLKAVVSKQIEATESEIDSLENELKLLISDNGSVHPCTSSSSSLPLVCVSKPCNEIGITSNLIPRPVPLQTSGDMIKEKRRGSLEGELAEGKDEDMDSPGTATSKFAEPSYLGKSVSQVDTRVECSWNTNASRHYNELKSSEYAVNKEETNARPSENIDSSRMLSDDYGVQTENIYDLIVASNKESAHRACEVLSKLLPTNLSCFDTSKIDSNSCSTCWKDNPLVKEKFTMRKRFMRFKEKVTTLKFRVFQHLWKEDLRLLSIKRSRAKSQKKFELGTRTLNSGYQKHRASIRSRFSSPAGNLSLVPTTQVINFASNLLADTDTKIYRSALNMPCLVLDNKEKIISRFISSNGLVEDPCAAEKERCMINPWTSEERDIFLDKLSIFGKDFRKIACFLNHKTTADCVEFYYKNHKSDSFQNTKKKPEFAKKGKSYSKNTYLVTSGKRWNRDNNAASLDLLGAASAMAANSNDGLKNQKYVPRLILGSCNSRTSCTEDGFSKSSAVNILGNEREHVAADVLAGICGSLSSEAMSSCITSSIDVGEGCQERKRQPLSLSKRRSLTPEVAHEVDEGTCSDESCGEVDPTNWTDEEKSIFIRAVSSYGKDFAMISQCIRTKSTGQCKLFFSKARKCLGLDVMHLGSCGGEARVSDNTNGGGGSDTEDTCVVETGSGICGEKSVSRPDDALSLSSMKANQNETHPLGTVIVHPDSDSLDKMNSTGELDIKVQLHQEDAVSAESEKNNADLVLDGDTNFGNSADRELLDVKVLDNEYASSDMKSGHNEAVEFGSSVKPAFDLEVSNSVKISTPAADHVGCVDNSLGQEAGPQFSLPGNSFNGEGLVIMPLSTGNGSHSAASDSLVTGALPGCEHKNATKADTAHCSVSQNSVLQDPSLVQNEKSLNLTSKLDSKKANNIQFQNSLSAEVGHLHEHSSMDHINLSKSFQPYPTSVPTKKGMNGDIGCYKPTASLISKVDMNFRSHDLLPQESCLQKCNALKHHDVRAEIQLLSQDQSKENPRRPQPLCLSGSDKPTRSGDVKLFGQILSHPSTQQKPNSRAEEKENGNAKHAKHAKLYDNSYNLKFTPTQNVDGVLASNKFDHNNYLGLRNLPVRSFGFWDGNRIQTGLPSLPDSAILLAKYPAAFSNYPTSSLKVEQQQLQRINDCNLSGAPVMPTRQLNSSKGVADCQAYRNCDGAALQPFAVDVKQQHDRFFSELQRRGTEFDAASSVQLQARGMVGLNPLSKGGILLGAGGPRNTVSDPVAAIRRHYARSEQYNGQIGNIIRKEEAWRSNADVGR